jgi:hypothetical protein
MRVAVGMGNRRLNAMGNDIQPPAALEARLAVLCETIAGLRAPDTRVTTTRRSQWRAVELLPIISRSRVPVSAPVTGT